MLVAPWDRLCVPRELVCDFLAVFARAEYALKAGGFAKAVGGDRAAADWTKFAKNVSSGFDREASPELSRAVTYLITNPPQRQTYQVENDLGWGAVPVKSNASHAERLVEYVKCVRNNLFHGGKYLPVPASAPDRDFLLLSSMVVLSALLLLNSTVSLEYSA